MKFAFAILSLLLIVSCNTSKEDKVEFPYDKSNVNAYWNVVNDFGKKGYVPHYRHLTDYNLKYRESKNEFEQHVFYWEKISEDDYLKDSVFYAESQSLFFSQDKEFLHWMISHKNDTIHDKYHTVKNQHDDDSTTFGTSHQFWQVFINPLRSVAFGGSGTTSEQFLNLSIIYLKGELFDGIKSHEGAAYILTQYKEIESFLRLNKNASTKDLRRLWKARKK